MTTISPIGCGSGSCGCGKSSSAISSLQALTDKPEATSIDLPEPIFRQSPGVVPLGPKRINGITLVSPEADLADTDWLELAHIELLRQQAVASGLLPALIEHEAPALSESDRAIIEAMVDEAVRTPQPSEQERERYFEANKAKFVMGQALHLRHILFAVTPGVNVHALAAHAEKALLSLQGKDASLDQFARLARELSNCPSGVQGGDLGWIGPNDCAPELVNELFHLKQTPWNLGLHPRLVHSRFGFHILDVLDRREGQQKAYEEVRERIAAMLTLQSRAKALHQYMRLLVGQANIEGLQMEGADSPLVQ
jgi:peptidyl-prolyl cis-trans isomerase C